MCAYNNCSRWEQKHDEKFPREAWWPFSPCKWYRSEERNKKLKFIFQTLHEREEHFHNLKKQLFINYNGCKIASSANTRRKKKFFYVLNQIYG